MGGGDIVRWSVYKTVRWIWRSLPKSKRHPMGPSVKRDPIHYLQLPQQPLLLQQQQVQSKFANYTRIHPSLTKIKHLNSSNNPVMVHWFPTRSDSPSSTRMPSISLFLLLPTMNNSQAYDLHQLTLISINQHSHNTSCSNSNITINSIHHSHTTIFINNSSSSNKPTSIL